MNRRHDIDALRALAFAGVILYHVAMAYVAPWHWHLKSEYAAGWLQWPMQALNLWRLELVFLVSGLALAIVSRGAGPRQLIRARSLRLLLPLAFGMAFIVPWQAYAQAVANGSIEPGFGTFAWRYLRGGPWPRNAFDGSDFGVTWNHLWYLVYLWAYTVVLALLLPALRSRAGRRVASAFIALRGARLLVLPIVPLLLYGLLLWPRFPVTHDLVHDGWAHAVCFTLFLYGWWIGLDEGLWAEFARLRHRALALAVALFVLYAGLRMAVLAGAPELRPLARGAADAYLWMAVVAVLGWAHAHLNRPWPWLAWANESVYPWYVLHQTLIIAALVWLMPLGLGPWLEPLAVLAVTIGGCWAITDGLVRRVAWLRPLFGLRRRARLPRPSPSRPACRSAHSGGSPGRPCPPGTS